MNVDFLRLLRLFLLSCGLIAFAGCTSSGGGGGSSSSSSSSSSTSSSSTSSSSSSSSSGGASKFFGTAAGQPNDYEDLLTYFNQITPENAGKWGSVEATRDVMDWTALDTAYQFSRDHNIPFKLHTLIWGQQQPAWLDTLTPEEQLEEIDEWMSELAARYPDVEMIDVVNEPLHSPPSYKDALDGDLSTCDALDGDGVTCWDWVITAFQMARAHFPNAQLILNDYQILHLPQFTAQYRQIIDLLNARGLIDAIGEQGHFLERTQPSMVKTNLDTLAETGLPIYITEFDLNFADDAQQANVMRDLFKVFWEHPSVMGVTHWGYQQGNTWQSNAYLLHTDGTERPALQWLVCYLAGGGDDCDVPEYVPSGWHGDEFGVTLQAESYDKGEGLVALGDVVAYTNPGDYIKFSGVEFQNGWDKLWLTYARGLNEDNGATITIHLDSLENPPVETIPVPYTGGWSDFDTIEIDWTPISTTHDVYIRFNVDDEAVANLDNVRFGRPEPVSDINLVGDSGFEGASVDGGWGNFGSGAALSLSDEQANSDEQSLKITGRSNTNGYASYWLTDKVSTGTTYSVSAYAFHDGATADTVRLAAKIACEGQADAYNWLDNNTAVQPNTWTKLSANLVIPDGCDINEVQIYFEGTAAASTVYLDDVKVAPLNFVGDGGFEGVSLDGGWSAFGSDTVLSLSAAQSHAGAQSMLADRSTGTGGFAAYWLTDVMTPGLSYLASAWVYQTGGGADTVRMVAKVACDGESDDYIWVANNESVAANTWTQLSGAFAVPLDCDINEVQLYLEGTTAGVDVYIDDVSVTLPADNLVSGGDFEDAALDGGWGVWYMTGTNLALSTDKAYTGSKSLLASNRTANSYPSYNLTALVEPGTTYNVSAQALHTGAGNETITMTAKLACSGKSDSYTQLASVTEVTPDTWTELSNNPLTIPADCTVTEARIYFEGTTVGVDVYLDDVSVMAQ